jgi:NAD-dependent DNA ligase
MDLMEACEVDGLGEKSLQNIVNSIKHASTNVPVWRWLGALPCNAVSDKTWKIILNSVYGNDMNVASDDITQLCYLNDPDDFLNKMLWYTHGIGPATIASINEGIRNNWTNMQRMIDYITFEKSSVNTKGVVCLSGTRDERLTNELERRGYEVTDAFNKKCIAVVIPNPMFTSSKVDKANKNGIPVYTMNQVLNDGAL